MSLKVEIKLSIEFFWGGTLDKAYSILDVQSHISHEWETISRVDHSENILGTSLIMELWKVTCVLRKYITILTQTWVTNSTQVMLNKSNSRGSKTKSDPRPFLQPPTIHKQGPYLYNVSIMHWRMYCTCYITHLARIPAYINFACSIADYSWLNPLLATELMILSILWLL